MQNPNKPIWFDKPEEKVTEINVGDASPYKIMVCTPCHSDTSMHYTQAAPKHTPVSYTHLTLPTIYSV